MGVYYMKHPKHGTKVATQEEEVEHDKKRGWTEYELDAPVQAEQPVSNTLSVPKKAEARA